MANPLKILTVLTASQAVKMEQGVDVNNQKVTGLADGTVSTDAVAYGQLTNLSSSMKSYVDAADGVLSGTIASETSRALAAEGALSGAIVAEATRAIAAEGALSSSFSSSLAAEVAARIADVDAEEARALAAEGALSSSFSSSMAAEVAARIADVDAEEARALAAEGALSSSFSSSIAAEAAARAAEDLTFLKLDGTRAMTAALNMGGFDITSAKSGSFSGDVTVGGNLQVNGALTYVNTTNLDVTDKLVTLAKGAVNAAAANGGGIELEGASASFTYSQTNDSWVSNKNLEVQGNASVNAELYISGASDFSYISAVVRDGSGRYDVDAAIQALDIAVSGAVNAGSTGLDTLKGNYDNLRQVITGTLTSGTALLTLTGAQFAAAEIDNLALDVMIDADNTGYTNDLVAIKMFVDGAAVKVQIDAPGAAAAKYRMIVVNEADGKL